MELGVVSSTTAVTLSESDISGLGNDGSFIKMNFSGWDAMNNIERVSQTDTFPAANSGAFMAFAA